MKETDEAKRLRVLGTASGQAYMWAEAVTVQARRVFDPTSVTVTHMADALLQALAVRNVLRAAELALRVATGDERDVLEKAVTDFKQALPDAVRLRNVLDHFDDYTLGSGRMQKGQEAPAPYPISYERGADHYILHVGPLSIDVRAAAQAAEGLATAIILGEPRT